MIPSYLRKLSSASWGGSYVKWKKFYSVKLGYETFPGIYLIIRHGIFFPTQIFRLIRNFSFRVSTNESRVLRLQLESFRVLPLSFLPRLKLDRFGRERHWRLFVGQIVDAIQPVVSEIHESFVRSPDILALKLRILDRESGN